MRQVEMTRWKAWWMIVIGGVSVGMVSLDAVRTLSALMYRKADGVVVSSSVKVGAQRSSRPIIEYRYHVGGQELTGSRYAISSFDAAGTQPWAEGVVRSFPAGAACTVYYDPNDPHDSVLVRSVAAGTALVWLLAFGLGGAFVWWGAGWLRRLPPQPPRSESVGNSG